MDVLTALARRPGEVVTREALLAEVWGDTAISGDGLFRHISELRRALGDDARNPTFIQTIPKRGYLLMSAPSLTDQDHEPVQTVRHSRTGASGFLLAVAVSGLLLTIHPGVGAESGRRDRAVRLAAAAKGSEAFLAFARGRVHDERMTCPSYRRAREAYESALSASRPFAGAANAYADVLIASAILGCEPTNLAIAALDRFAQMPRHGLAFSEADRLRIAAVQSLFGDGGAAHAGRLLEAAAVREPDSRSDILWAVQRIAEGDTAGAVTAARRALAADPAALGENWALALVLYFDRRYADAVAQLRLTLETYPESEGAGNLMLLALAAIDLETAANLARRWTGDTPMKDAGRLGFAPAYVRALAGDTEPARLLLESWRPADGSAWAPATGAAALSRALGRQGEYAAWMTRAETERDIWLLFRAVDPALAPPGTR